MSYDEYSVGSGNYYASGVKRVVSKLTDMGIEVPKQALEYPKPESRPRLSQAFMYIEHAVMDWFTDRDYTQAQALIHFQPASDEWHAIYAIDDGNQPIDLANGTLCPTCLDALGAIIIGCEGETERIDHCRMVDDDIIVIIDGEEAFRIEPVHVEPFDLSARDRVQNTFKGMRQGSTAWALSHAVKLPGFSNMEAENKDLDTNPRLGMFLGFPRNWAIAMRSALKQVGIKVKQSQAQELAAVFFGASNWHQLIKYQDVPNERMAPVELAFKTQGQEHFRYYRTTEEAIFAVGKILENYPEPVVIQKFRLSLNDERAVIYASTLQAWQSRKHDYSLNQAFLRSGSSDYCTQSDSTAEETELAQQLLGEILMETGETLVVSMSKSSKLYRQ